MSARPDPTKHLVAYWSKREHDIMFDGPCGPDRHLLCAALCSIKIGDVALVEELKRRGYVIETLRFSVQRNRSCNEPDPRVAKDDTGKQP